MQDKAFSRRRLIAGTVDFLALLVTILGFLYYLVLAYGGDPFPQTLL